MKKSILNFILLLILIIQYGNLWSDESSPRREISIIVNELGYYPDKISIFEGEIVRFYFISAQENFTGCLSFAQSLNAPFMVGKFGEISMAEYAFMHPGKWVFQCPSFKFKGEIIVIGKKSEELNLKNEGEWIPKKSLLE